MTGPLEYPLELALLGATLPSRIRQGWKQKTRKKGYFRKQELERGMETGAWRNGRLLQQESFCTDPPSSNTQTYNCGEHSSHMLGYRQLYRVSLSQQVQEQWTWGLLGPDSSVEISQGLNTSQRPCSQNLAWAQSRNNHSDPKQLYHLLVFDGVPLGNLGSSLLIHVSGFQFLFQFSEFNTVGKMQL